MKKRKREWKKFEQRMQRLLKNAGFECPDDERKAEIIRQVPGRHQIDAIGWHENVLIVVECKSTSSLKKKSLKNIVAEVSAEARDVKKWWGKQGAPRPIVKSVVATLHVDVTTSDREHGKRKRISIWDDDVVSYFHKKVRALGTWTRNEIMWDLGIRNAPFKDEPIVVEGAIEIRQKRRKLYIFPITPSDLLSIGFVHRKDPNYPKGYQRIIVPEKVERLREYLQSRDGLLPNSIIINLSQSPKFFAYPGLPKSQARVGRLTIKRTPCSAWIIDGQHRLMAFADPQTEAKARGFKLVAVAFSGLNHVGQAKIFLKINETQKRISPNLVYSLAAYLSPKEPRGIAAKVVQELSEKAPFKQRVVTEPWERGPIKLANFADSLRKTGLVPASRQQVRPSLMPELQKVIISFYRRFLKKAPNTEDVRDFVLSNNGVAVVLRVLKRALDCAGGRLSGKGMNQSARAAAGFNWKRAVRQGAYSSEGDRRRLAFKVMRTVRKRCTWFTLPS